MHQNNLFRKDGTAIVYCPNCNKELKPNIPENSKKLIGCDDCQMLFSIQLIAKPNTKPYWCRNELYKKYIRNLVPKSRKYDYDKIYDYICECPRFNDEILKKFSFTSDSTFIGIYRRFLQTKKIIKFRYTGRGEGIGKRGAISNLQPFIIYYKKGEEILAWEKINKRFKLGGKKWQEIGKPLLGELVATGKSTGIRMIKEEG